MEIVWTALYLVVGLYSSFRFYWSEIYSEIADECYGMAGFIVFIALLSAAFWPIFLAALAVYGIFELTGRGISKVIKAGQNRKDENE